MRIEPPPRALLVAWFVALGIAVALSIWVAADDRLPGEVDAMRRVHGWPFPGGTLADFVRALTSTEVALGVGFALVALMWWRGARREALALGVMLLVLPLLQAGLKNIVDRPRPAPDVVAARAGFSSESFPSGHTMSTTALYSYVLWLSLRRQWIAGSHLVAALAGAWSAFVLAMTGIVNVWLGVHWPSDVIGGYAWGLVLALPALRFARRNTASAPG